VSILGWRVMQSKCWKTRSRNQNMLNHEKLHADVHKWRAVINFHDSATNADNHHENLLHSPASQIVHQVVSSSLYQTLRNGQRENKRIVWVFSCSRTIAMVTWDKLHWICCFEILAMDNNTSRDQDNDWITYRFARFELLAQAEICENNMTLGI